MCLYLNIFRRVYKCENVIQSLFTTSHTTLLKFEQIQMFNQKRTKPYKQWKNSFNICSSSSLITVGLEFRENFLGLI